MANFIQRPRLFNQAQAYQQGQLNRNRFDAGQIANRTNAFNLQNAQQNAPIIRQQKRIEFAQSVQNLTDSQRKATIAKMEPILQATRLYSQMPVEQQAADWGRFTQAMIQRGAEPEEMNQPYSPELISEKLQDLEWAYGTVEKFDAPKAVTLPGGGQGFAQPGDRGNWRQMRGGYLPPEKGPLAKVEVINKMGDEADKAVGKAMGNRYTKIYESGNAAEETINQIRQQKNIDITTGAFEPAKAGFAAIISGLGFDNYSRMIANVPNAQAFQAVSARLVNKVLNEAKGPQTEGDAQRARSTISRLGNHPAARGFIEDSLLALALRKVQMRDFIDGMLVEDGASFRDAMRAWRKYTMSTPSVSDFRVDKNGLPVFYFAFKEALEEANPGITEEQIIEAWTIKPKAEK